jgi:hypothetical protein
LRYSAWYSTGVIVAEACDRADGEFGSPLGRDILPKWVPVLGPQKHPEEIAGIKLNIGV